MSLWFKESGNPDGETVIFLHGLLASAQNWQGITKRLNSEYHTFCVDLPNHGNSEHHSNADYTLMLNEFEKFIEESGLIKFHLVGHSLGGKVAMLYALKHPQKINKLVIEDIAPKVYPMRFLPLMEAMLAVDLGELKSRREIDNVLAESIPDKMLRMFLMTNLSTKGDCFEWRVNLPALIKDAEGLMKFPVEESVVYDYPTLFLCGRNSDYVMENDFDCIKGFFPKSKITHIEDTGHWLHAEKPEVFIEKLKIFLQE